VISVTLSLKCYRNCLSCVLYECEMWSNESAVELHVCHPSSHVIRYGHIKVRHIVCSMVIVPWSPRQDRPTHFGCRRRSSAIDGGRRCWYSSWVVLHYHFCATAWNTSGLDIPFHRFSINLYLRTNLCRIPNSDSFVVTLINCKIIQTYQYETGCVLIRIHT